MTKRNFPPAATARARVPAKLTATIQGDRFDYIEPSIVCAAHHALEIFEHSGSIHSIESGGKVIWRHDPADARRSFRKLEKLAVGKCER